MATTFDVISLGNFASIDTTEGNTVADSAGVLVGETMGSAGSPLFDNIQTLSLVDASGGLGTEYDQDNDAASDTFSIDGGPAQTFDAAAVYNVTITYLNGATDTVDLIVFQDIAGDTYLSPGLNNAALQAGPVQSISINSVVDDDNSGLQTAPDAATLVAPVDGTAGNDTIDDGFADVDGDQIGIGNDVILAGAGDDVVQAGSGDDTIEGGTGADALSGGAGNDSFVTRDGFGNDTITGGEGGIDVDAVDLNAVTPAVTVTFSGDNAGVATDGNDTISFSEIEAFILTNQDDVLNAEASTSWQLLDGMGGADTIIGSMTADLIYGGTGNDSLDGGSENDIIDGGAGDDILLAGFGSDAFIGGSGIDVVDIGGSDVANFNFTINLTTGTDLFGNTYSGIENIIGGDGSDDITGNTDDNRLEGGNDADTFRIGDAFGSDTIIGGEGGTDNDAIDFSAVTGPVSVVYSGSEAGTITDGTDTLNFSQLEGLTLSEGADNVDASHDSAGFTAHLRGGDDSAIGGSGADSLVGGLGADTILGGAGDDLIDGEGELLDNVSLSAPVFSEFQNTTLEGWQSDAGTNEIWANGRNGVLSTDGSTILELDGVAGVVDNLYQDVETTAGEVYELTLTARARASFEGDSIEVYWDGALVETITITDSSQWQTFTVLVTGDGNPARLELREPADEDNSGGPLIDTISLRSVSNDLLLGGDGSDTVTGGAGADTLYGGAGADRLEGAADADRFIIEDGFGNDLIQGGEGVSTGTDDDVIDLSALSGPVTLTYTGDEAGTISDGTDTITFSGIERIILSDIGDQVDASALSAQPVNLDVAGGNDTVIGTELGDTIAGGDGDDLIDGGEGDDLLTTGLGNDTLIGGQGNDTLMNSDGDDSLDGGDGDDSIVATGGEDTLRGGAGADTMDGGEDADTFIIEDGFGNDVITGGEGTTDPGDRDFDVIDLSAMTDPVTVTFTGAEAGTITDGTDTITFSEIEQVITTDQADVVDASGQTGTTGINVDTRAGDDTITGGNNADTIHAGDGDDSVMGGSGADSIDGGTGADTITGDAGNDTIHGGAGADSIDGGGSADSLEGGDGNDTLSGGGGRDTLRGGDGDDTLLGGTGDDSIDGGAGADSIEAGDGNDFVTYATGGDTVDGGAGNDTLRGGFDQGTDDAVLRGGDGDDDITTYGADDTVYGDAGNDFINADSGDELIDGGADNDTIFASYGNDTITGGTGDDSISGGGGNDIFHYSAGDGLDTITDFNTGNTGALDDGDSTNNDFIDLSSFYDNLQELYADQADDGVLNQSNTLDGAGRTVDYSDNSQFSSGEGITFQGASADNSSFTAENTAVTCFTTGTAIRTPRGDVLVDDLRVGDLVATLDNGPQPIRWIGTSAYDAAALRAHPHLRPVLIARGRLGNARDLLVSRQHGMLVAGRLARAAHLTDSPGVRIANGKRQVTYLHLMFDAHQIIFAENAATESFYPGRQAIRSISPMAQRTLLQAFPVLTPDLTAQGIAKAYGDPARPYLHRRDVNLLITVSGTQHDLPETARNKEPESA